MSTSRRHIRLAGLDEARLAVDVWREAAAWAKASGHSYWLPHDIKLEMAEARSRAGELVVGFERDELCACMLVQNADPIYWPERPAGSALYLHRLAVKRAFVGQGWGVALIAWAAGHAAGLPLRLDCAPRPRLMNLYSSNGFVPVDDAPVERGGFSVVRFERLPG